MSCVSVLHKNIAVCEVTILWQVFVAELMSGVEECVAQSSHGRSHEDIVKVLFDWTIL